ncbi:MAG: hypothetical protein Q8K36_05155 [Alphaproteobacteria bacterium]|nr:hypothetical protein [Alphaproteobacteria bacterium]
MSHRLKLTLMALSIVASNPVLASSDAGGYVAPAAESHQNSFTNLQQINDCSITTESREEAPIVTEITPPATIKAKAEVFYPVITNEEMILILKTAKKNYIEEFEKYPDFSIFINIYQSRDCRLGIDYSIENIIRGLESGSLSISIPHINSYIGMAFYSIKGYSPAAGYNVLYLQVQLYKKC